MRWLTAWLALNQLKYVEDCKCPEYANSEHFFWFQTLLFKDENTEAKTASQGQESQLF